MAQHRGVQVVGEVADVVGQGAGALVEGPDVGQNVFAHARLVHPALEAAERDGQAGQLLAHVVVQIAGHPRPLGVLGLDQPTGQMLDLAMAPLEGGPARVNLQLRPPCVR